MPSTMQAPPAASDLKREISELLGMPADEIADDDSLAMLGVGSLEVMRLATRWRRAGLDIDFTALVEEPTVADWERHLREVWAAAGTGAEGSS